MLEVGVVVDGSSVVLFVELEIIVGVAVSMGTPAAGPGVSCRLFVSKAVGAAVTGLAGSEVGSRVFGYNVGFPVGDGVASKVASKVGGIVVVSIKVGEKVIELTESG